MGLGDSIGRAVVIGGFGSIALRQALGLAWKILFCWLLILAVITVISIIMFMWNNKKASAERQLTEATELTLI